MAVGLKTLLEAAQYLEEQEQQQKSPISTIVNSNHLNGVGHHLNNDTNTSCFIAHYSLAVAGNRNATVNGTAVTQQQLQTTTILNDENHHKTSNIEGFFANGHVETASASSSSSVAVGDNFATRKSTCPNIIAKNTGNNKKQQQHQNIATSAPASSTGFQQVAFGNGFSLTTKTKSPTELFISSNGSSGSGNGNVSDRKDVNETNNNNNNNNNNCSINVNGNKGQLVTGAIIQQQQQHMNNHHSTLPTNTSNILNSSTNNNTSSSSNNNNNNINNINNNNNNNHHKLLTNNNKSTINTVNNNINDDFDTNSLSPPGPQRVRSASTSSNVYVFGSLDHAKSAANHANRLQSNVLHANADGKGLQMMLVNEANGANNIASWMINNHSPQKNNSMEGITSQMDVMSPKSFTNIGSQSHMSISSLGSNGRRRTMSSTSNGAGTREVHNKLEKNRRAHLKECYEKLKSQLNLKDEDRKKTSNLAVLGEALNQVMALQKKDQELEAKIEQLAKDKINSQKRIVTLKRELGPRYEQIFSGIFPDSEITMTSIPNERDNFNNTAFLSSGRGSVLYSSSNSLSSSGGSSCNNTLLSSPGGVNHLQTNATTIIPVIPKNNMAGIKLSGIGNTTKTNTSLSTVSKNSDIFLQQQQQQQNKMSTTTTINNNAFNITSSPGSPSSSTVMGVNNLVISTATVNVGNLPLSLTAKNISDTSLTRGSPTPSTPSPSPSSSSGVSSSSSFISSSPPIVNVGHVGNNNSTPSLTIVNGTTTINNSSSNNNNNCTTTTTRQVCINIPNGLKFHVANNGIGINTASAGVVSFQGTIPNGVTGATTTTTVGTTTTAVTKNGNYQP